MSQSRLPSSMTVGRRGGRCCTERWEPDVCSAPRQWRQRDRRTPSTGRASASHVLGRSEIVLLRDEHVELANKSRAAVQLATDICDTRCVRGVETSPSSHVRPTTKRTTRTLTSGWIRNDVWCRTRLGRRDRVGVLVGTIDREQGTFGVDSRATTSPSGVEILRLRFVRPPESSATAEREVRAGTASKRAVVCGLSSPDRELHRHGTLRGRASSAPRTAVPDWTRNALRTRRARI